MAYEHFKATVWAKHIETQLPKYTVFKNGCNFQFEGEAGEGKTVKIVGIARPTIKKYVAGTEIESAETVQDNSVLLKIDQADYFNFVVDDLDQAQATAKMMPALTEEATIALAEAEDSFIAKELATNAGTKLASAQVTTAAEAKAIVDSALVSLWKAGARKQSIGIYLTPEFYDLFLTHIEALKTDNGTVLANGELGKYRGAKVFMTNNAYNDGTDDHIIVKTDKAYAYCNGIDKLVPYSPEKAFGDALKGLNTYGGKMVRPAECVAAAVHYK